MSNKADRQRREFAGLRVRVATSLPFDAVRSNLRELMGNTTLGEVVGLASKVASKEEYHRLVSERFVGPSGFMFFAEIDHGAWISLYGLDRRSVRWILGNPLIAITMIRHDVSAGLFVPVELLLTENEGKDGCTVDYVVPSTLIALDDASPELRAAAQGLDEKYEALVANATRFEAGSHD